MYYAHSANSAGRSEPLEEHLRKTADLAEIFASAFGEGNAGKLMGWYHDLGKASVLFQDVLQHNEHNVNHAAAGAWIATGTTIESVRALCETFRCYEARGFISANLAAETGFDESDLKALFEAILNMYEHDHSASKGEMAVVSPLIIFKHIGTDTDQAQRARQAKLGCSPAHKLFELVTAKKKDGVELPRNYTDYDFSVNMSAIPEGVQIGFLDSPYGDIVWDKLPDHSILQDG